MGWIWGVLCFDVMLTIIAVEFYKLRKIHIRTEGTLNRIHVKPESVCGDLDAISGTRIELPRHF
ncbi:MAG TPA: hypothetical protein VI685_08610 [Candidatus Angelobacter sp.]